MSASQAAAAIRPASEHERLRQRRVLRYALGATLATTIALAINWQLSFLAAVLSLGYLAAPVRLPWRTGIGLVVIVGIASLAGVVVGRLLIPYPLVFLPFLALLLLRIFYALQGGLSPLVVIWLLIALLVIPLLTMQSPDVAIVVAGGLFVDSIATVLIVWLTWGLLPDPPVKQAASAPAAPAAAAPAAAAPVATAQSPTPTEKFQRALTITLIVMPVVILFYTLQMTGGILIMVMIALLSIQPGFAQSFKAGAALIVANAIGGVGAIIYYEVLVMVPEFFFLIMLIFLAALFFGARVFSDKPKAGLYKTGFSTMLLLICSTTTSTDEADAEAYVRVFQIMLAVIYVVVAFGFIDRWRRRREV